MRQRDNNNNNNNHKLGAGWLAGDGRAGLGWAGLSEVLLVQLG